MSPLDLVKNISGLLFTGCTVIVLVFVNFLIGSSQAGVFGTELPTKAVHAVLGPALILINSALVVFLFAFYRTEVDQASLSAIQQYQPKWVLGPILNPFYVGRNPLLNCLGYAFLIILWWLGMHSFAYS